MTPIVTSAAAAAAAAAPTAAATTTTHSNIEGTASCADYVAHKNSSSSSTTATLNSLKRSRQADITTATSPSFKRRCVADLDGSDSSCSSADEDDNLPVNHHHPSNNSSSSSSSISVYKSPSSSYRSNKTALFKIRRAMSLNSVAPATTGTFFSPPSPPHSHHAYEDLDSPNNNNSVATKAYHHNACFSSSSDSEDENNAIVATGAVTPITTTKPFLSSHTAIPKKSHSRHKSISVATLRRHCTMMNPDTQTGGFLPFNDATNIYANSNNHITSTTFLPANTAATAAAAPVVPASLPTPSSLGGMGSSRKRRAPAVPRCDLVARARCFDYLVSAIDEVWAQYCTYTSCAEDEMYAVDEDEKRSKTWKHKRNTSVYSDHELPTSPASLCEEDGNYSSTNESYGPRTPYHDSGSRYNTSPARQMYSCNTSKIVYDEYNHNDECDDSVESSTQNDSATLSAVSDKSLAPSEQPGSVRLLHLKQRLMKAKYYLQDLVDRDDIDSSCAFWNKWDLVKYPAIELVEDDGEDDDTVETVTDELENGRHYASVY
ncbi:uncharacterized protein SAPINGB_P003366 [Magnusiomyces paraingens]|uniref:Uncharacterized protein n=1 Tax=Magnusiomyces paraingens TaxID=2606893 RepID=A0A5E8BWE7_9ASCO|nr:uncharacterized protein SAPINGB_P003366 [Saprochaete ingens]VVT53025.1 unnamed protein product [Saprochaete ingens]